MKIEFKKSHGHYLTFVAENVHVEEDIDERIYSKLPDGKSDFSKPPLRDVSDDCMAQFVNILDDLVYYRERDYDSSELIKRLFDKLPADIAQSLSKSLYEQFREEE